MWPEAANIQDFRPTGGWNARQYWKYQFPSFQRIGRVFPSDPICIQSTLLQQQALTNHNLEGPAEFLVRNRVFPCHKLEKAGGQRCSIALSWTMAFPRLAKRFSLHFCEWWEAMLNFITLTHILPLNGSNRTTEIDSAWWKRGFIWPGDEVSLRMLF